MSVLILTRELDPTADMVVRALSVTGTPVVRMDPGALPLDLSMVARFQGGTWSGTLTDAHRSIDLAEVTAVYNRRPNTPTIDLADLHPADRTWAENECYEAFYGVLYSLDARWVNRPDRNRTAALKALQLPMAAACGFQVPETILTNSTADARDFAHRGPTVYKTLRGVPQREIEHENTRRALIIHTSAVSAAEVDDSVRNCIVQFQRRIVPLYEVRTIAVGDQLFSARIDSPSGQPGEITDWRAYQRTDRIRFTAIETPREIADSIHLFLERAGLFYGAFDFMVDTEAWHYLEVNPNGQFAFVEYATGQPITRAVADLLRAGAPAASGTLPDSDPAPLMLAG